MINGGEREMEDGLRLGREWKGDEKWKEILSMFQGSEMEVEIKRNNS